MFRSGKIYVFGVFFLLAALLFTCCEDDFSWVRSTEKLLTGTLWERESCIDNTTNTEIATTYLVYEFRDDGTYILTPADSTSPWYGTWEFVDDEEYIRIGSNTYRIQTLTKKVLALRYGDLDFFYVPIEDQ